MSRHDAVPDLTGHEPGFILRMVHEAIHGRVLEELARIVRAVETLGERMTTFGDELAKLQAAVQADHDAIVRLLTDFKNAGNLTPDQVQRADALINDIQSDTAAIDSADPAPAQTSDGAPADGSESAA